MSEYLTVSEIAERWRVSRMTIYRFVEREDLPCLVVGRSLRIPLKAVEHVEEMGGISL